MACSSWVWTQLKRLRESLKNVQVSDDWYPCYDRDTNPYVIARVTLYDMCEVPSNKYPKRNIVRFDVRIAFWGADDTGMCKEYSFPDLHLANSTYDMWSRWLGNVGVLSKQILSTVGFGGA